jgi:transposase-like protein
MARRGARRDVGKERFWRRMLRLWRRSGRSIRDFCGEHDISEPSFFAWRRTLAERDRHRDRRRNRQRGACKASAGGDGDGPSTANTDQPAFVPLRVVAITSQRPGTAFEVVLKGGRVVRVPAHFDAASLRQLLALLEEASPEEERPC